MKHGYGAIAHKLCEYEFTCGVGDSIATLSLSVPLALGYMTTIIRCSGGAYDERWRLDGVTGTRERRDARPETKDRDATERSERV